MFDQPFYNRLKEFAAMYGYEEEGEIHDLFDRSRKNLATVASPDDIAEAMLDLADPLSAIDDPLDDDPPPKIGGLGLVPKEVQTPIAQQARPTISFASKGPRNGTEIDVTVDVKSRFMPKMVKGFPPNFYQVYKNYDILIFGDAYSITRVVRDMFVLRPEIPYKTYKENVNKSEFTRREIQRNATLKLREPPQTFP